MLGQVSVNFAYLPKDRSSKRNSVVIEPHTRSFITQKRLTLIMGKETRSQHQAQTDFVTNSHLSLLFF